jgi:hypothetical protein
MVDPVWDDDAELREAGKAERERYQQSKPNGSGEPLICQPLALSAISAIPPRPWAYGKFLLFGSVSALGAVDGGGKGAHATVIGLSMITGRALLGERVWRKGPVAIIAYEDDETEWRRRIAAACIHYGIDYESVIGGFHFITRLGSRVCIAAHSSNGNVKFPDGDAITKRLKEIGAVLLIIDPLNHAHALEDGNNNVLMAKVADEIARIAQQSNVAALVLHHLRKGAGGTPDDLMGAVSLRATCRCVRILARITADQAGKLELPPHQAWRYSRITGSKENYAPPPEFVTSYRLVSVALGNGDDLYAEGDNVQVADRWSPPDTFEGISLNQIEKIFAALRDPPSPGLRYSPDQRSNEWVGLLIASITGKTHAEIRPIVRKWIKNEVLLKETCKKPNRHDGNCVSLNEAKAAEILGPLYFNAEAAE